MIEKLLTIVKIFKICRRDLKGCKHDVFVFIKVSIFPSILVRFAEVESSLNIIFRSIIN